MGNALPQNRGSAQEESRGCLSVSVAGTGPSLRSGKGHAAFTKVPDAALPFSPNPKRLIMKRIAALIMGFVLMTVLVAPASAKELVVAHDTNFMPFEF